MEFPKHAEQQQKIPNDDGTASDDELLGNARRYFRTA